ncbi:MAG: hypothetical protein LUE98_18880 [Tannerellaceae bacterium]|nr:hypothetical protein [Tannerellaceae bacterium]
MNYGRFFVLDSRTEDGLNEGFIRFRYRGLKIPDNKCSQESPKYPIYVCFAKDRIDFRVHYSTNERHMHCLLLSLPLKNIPELKDELIDPVSQAYGTTFPLGYPKGENMKNENTYFLYTLINEDRIIQSTLVSGKGYSYSDLSVFDIFDNNGNLKMPKDQINRFIRKLILDFIFDLDHSLVFENVPYYDYTIDCLKSSFFFSALRNKCRFYYYREIIVGNNSENVHALYGEYLANAEQDWCRSIRNPQSEYIFNKCKYIGENKDRGKGWFLSPEEEMLEVYNRGKLENDAYETMNYKSWIGGKSNKMSHETNLRRDIQEDRNATARWFFRRYSFTSIFCNKWGAGFFNYSLVLVFLLYMLFVRG